MAEQKTKPTQQSVTDFIGNVASEQMRDDCTVLMKLMKKITGSAPKMWGTSIVGFGEYHYTYDSGHSGHACLTGFSPRKQNISVYAMPVSDKPNPLLDTLGKHKATKGCIYIKKLDDINLTVLEQIIDQSVKALKKKYPATKKK